MDFVVDRLSEAVISCALCVHTVHSHLTFRLRAAGEIIEPDRISGSLFLARGTREKSCRALCSAWRKFHGDSDTSRHPARVPASQNLVFFGTGVGHMKA